MTTASSRPLHRPNQPTPPDSRQRLSSWKEIAAYLGCDVRTAIRWEKEHGLPVSRIGGAKGRSVFAYVADVDEWLAKADAADERSARPVVRWGMMWTPLRLGAALAIVVVFLLIVLAQRGLFERRIAEARLESGVLRAYTSHGRQVWAQPLAVSSMIDDATLPEPRVVDAADGDPTVFAAYNESARNDGLASLGGQLVSVSDRGRVRWRLATSETLSFGRNAYTAPWNVTTWLVTADRLHSMVAMAVHHQSWWPAIVLMADDSGRVVSRFVNSGWVESLAAIPGAEQLLVAGGISNSRDAGMVAVLDPRTANAQSPEDSGSAFRCTSCPAGAGGLLRYFVFPRSEVNRATFSEYNAVGPIDVLSDRILVHTTEAVRLPGGIVAGAIYEFSRDMQFRRAEYDHHYWDLHRQLEAEGKLHHSRSECPERNGPPLVKRWAPASGWSEVR